MNATSTSANTTTTPADELRKAAAALREMARNTSRGPWLIGDCELYPRWILSEGERDEHGYNDDVARISEDESDMFRVSDANWQWMAFAHPGIAEPLAAWLTFEATIYEQIPEDKQGACTPEHALAIAHAINGDGAR
ncbi:hypothetical protein ACBJ59_10945 [Nonomuraea sp. MTCD27]|uniref:hypothetical protein n=1 Tax=Nonomuraea sp. MTCD27 TaxID=1676747 RepID=UPI0035C1EF11